MRHGDYRESDLSLVAMSPEAAQHWNNANHMCWEGTNLDGEPISETEMKVACITAGALTARLIDVGNCLHPRQAVWQRCEQQAIWTNEVATSRGRHPA
jgi:hypothetical protein